MLDVIRLGCLISLSIAYIVEIGLNASRDRALTMARVILIIAYLFCLGMFCTELYMIF